MSHLKESLNTEVILKHITIFLFTLPKFYYCERVTFGWNDIISETRIALI